MNKYEKLLPPWLKSHLARTEENVKPFLSCLSSSGYQYKSILDFFYEADKKSPKEIETVCNCIIKLERPNTIMFIMQWVGDTRVKFDGSMLIELMQRKDISDGDKWTIGDIISRIKATGLDQYLRDELQSRPDANYSQTLVLAAARMLPPEEARPLAAKVLPFHPGHAAQAMGICGGKTELKLLQDWLKSPAATKVHRWVIRANEAAQRKIEKRLAKGKG